MKESNQQRTCRPLKTRPALPQIKRLAMLFLALSLILLLLPSCSQDVFSSTVRVIIPEHQWETYTGRRLWYTLVWTDGDGEHVRYVRQNEREVDIKVGTGTTVYICAYPLGNMLPYGTAFSPACVPAQAVLNQKEGYLADVLAGLEAPVREKINWETLVSVCRDKGIEPDGIDIQMLVSSCMNGNLSRKTIIKSGVFETGSFEVQSGTWISERDGEGRLVIENGRMESRNLTPGVYRYYGCECGLEMKIVVEGDGKVSCVFKSALVP